MGMASQGYELAESEINITLDRFKQEFTSADGSVEYVRHPLLLPFVARFVPFCRRRPILSILQRREKIYYMDKQEVGTLLTELAPTAATNSNSPPARQKKPSRSTPPRRRRRTPNPSPTWAPSGSSSSPTSPSAWPASASS